LEAKEILGHKLYEEQRAITGRCEREQRDPTPDEWVLIKEYDKRQRDEVYDPAWQRSVRISGAPA